MYDFAPTAKAPRGKGPRTKRQKTRRRRMLEQEQHVSHRRYLRPGLAPEADQENHIWQLDNPRG